VVEEARSQPAMSGSWEGLGQHISYHQLSGHVHEANLLLFNGLACKVELRVNMLGGFVIAMTGNKCDRGLVVLIHDGWLLLTKTQLGQ